MNPIQPTFSLKGMGMLLRMIAVLFSSIAAILSTLLPLLFHYPVSAIPMISVAFILLAGTIIVHGLLTHTFNDLTDHFSGTDQYSPGLLSGGSRVIQTGTMSVNMLKQLGKGVTVFLMIMIGIFVFYGYPKLAILTLIGIWGAASYSLKPFKLAYYPFVGEWLSLFPAMLALGIAAPWILLEQIPLWAWQNSLINAIGCMAWVMIHHIPDRDADRKAQPIKRTSVVWAEDKFGMQAAKFPAFLYYTIVGILLLWIGLTRPIGAIGAGFILIVTIYLIIKMNTEDVDAVTRLEKKLLLSAFLTAIWLGVIV